MNREQLASESTRPPDSFAEIGDKIGGIVLRPMSPPIWWIGLGISAFLLFGLVLCSGVLFFVGIGIWGVDIPVAWGFAITNFVWWVGIGHAGTLISAVLLLLNQDWRTSINRFAEAMTLFAVACAGLFPLLHLGRPWIFYFLLPYPNTMGLWPQFRSPLVWDVFAVSTYLVVSLMFWYAGLIPDLAALRDQARHRWQRLTFGVLALGWRGAAKHWQRYKAMYFIMAGLATPLVVSVHSVVSLDFAAAVVPGWHSAIFPPYFVAGAILSGFAMVVTISIPLRRIYKLDAYITDRHLENMAKLLLATSLMVAYGYVEETFIGWYSGSRYESYVTVNRATGPYAPTFWIMLACNVAIPQLLWWRSVRTWTAALFTIALLVNLGMWTERYVIVVTSLHRDFMPSAWGMYHGTAWDWMALIGSLGLFLTCFILFLRLLPMISISEEREALHRKLETLRCKVAS